MKRIEFHPEARVEFLEAVAYYEGQASGLGSDYIALVERTLAHVQDFPEIGRPPSVVVSVGSSYLAFHLACCIDTSPIESSSWRSCICVGGLDTGAPGFGSSVAEQRRQADSGRAQGLLGFWR